MKIRYFLIGFSFFSSMIAYNQTDLLNEKFSKGFPSNWKSIVNDTNTLAPEVSEYKTGWIATQPTNNLLDSVVGSSSYFDPAGQADRWLITPAVKLGSFGNFLTWKGKSHDPSYPDSYLIMISNKNVISAFKDTLLIVSRELAQDWVDHEINLSKEGYNDTTIFLAFVHRSYDAFKLYLDDIRVRKEDPLLVDEKGKSSFKVFPNPAVTELEIDFTSFTKGVVSIVDLNGKVISSNSFSGVSIQFPISQLNSGMYLIKLETDNGFEIQRFIKK